MLSDEVKLANKLKYFDILKNLNIDLTKIMQYLDSINFFEAPASTQYIRSYAGGLCEQSLKLCQTLGELCSAYGNGRYTKEDIIKVALFKDVYKAELYEFFTRNVKSDNGQWETVGAYRNKENRDVFGEIGFSSYMRVKDLIELSTEQIEAIVHSNGLNNFSPDIHEIMKQYKLVTLTRMAEMIINYVED